MSIFPNIQNEQKEVESIRLSHLLTHLDNLKRDSHLLRWRQEQICDSFSAFGLGVQVVGGMLRETRDQLESVYCYEERILAQECNSPVDSEKGMNMNVQLRSEDESSNRQREEVFPQTPSPITISDRKAGFKCVDVESPIPRRFRNSYRQSQGLLLDTSVSSDWEDD